MLQTITTASTDVTINVLEKPVIPVADFSASPTTGKAPLTVTFTDKSTGSPTSGLGTLETKVFQQPRILYIHTIKQENTLYSLTVRNELGSNTRKDI